MSTAVAKTDVPQSKTLDQYAKAINAAHGKSIEMLFEIAANLKAAHSELAQLGGNHEGQFIAWVEANCSFSRMTAHRYLSVLEAFAEHQCNTVLHCFDPTALYYLSRDTTPEDAIEDAIKAAEAGERVTLSKAKDIVAEYTVDAESSPVEDEPEEWDLFPCIKKLNGYVLKVYRHWPKEDIAAMVGKLRSVADEIEAGRYQGGEFIDDDVD